MSKDITISVSVPITIRIPSLGSEEEYLRQILNDPTVSPVGATEAENVAFFRECYRNQSKFLSTALSTPEFQARLAKAILLATGYYEGTDPTLSQIHAPISGASIPMTSFCLEIEPIARAAGIAQWLWQEGCSSVEMLDDILRSVSITFADAPKVSSELASGDNRETGGA